MMRMEHDTGRCTPYGHENFLGYDATIGKIASLYGRAHRCPSCERSFRSGEALQQHCRDVHTGEGA